MSVVGEAASIVSFVSLGIQVFDGCIKGFVLLSAALGFGSRAELLSCRLEWEHYRLSQWARSVGLLDDPPQLNVPNPLLVKRTLDNLYQLLTDVKHLKEHYKLDVKPTAAEVQLVNASTSPFGRLLDQTKPQVSRDTAKVFSRRTSPWKKLTWGALDSERFKLLLEDIGNLNKNLESILHPADRCASSKHNDAVIRYVIAHTRSKPTLNAIEGVLETVSPAVGASARLRCAGIQLDLISSTTPFTLKSLNPRPASPASASSTQRISPLDKGSLRQDPCLLSQYTGHHSPDVTREVGMYRGHPVVLEWKNITQSDDVKLKHRVAAVAKLLAKLNDPSFHSLCCLGFIKVPGFDRYAYLFSSPLLGDTISMKTLQELQTMKKSYVSMNQRLQIALALSQTVLQLHTAGLLHKSIRPDNILLFQENADAWSANESLPSAFLGGYETARADNLLETTEAPPLQGQHQLYRHPRSLGVTRSSFTKRFDLYSLGCVLIELGFWKPLQFILFRYHDCCTSRKSPTAASMPSSYENLNSATYHSILGEKASLFEASGHGSLMEGLRFHMGDRYSKLVTDCLTAAEWAADDELDETVEIQENNVSVLSDLLRVV